MELLPPSWFIPVCVKTARSSCFWHNEVFSEVLENLENEIQSLFNLPPAPKFEGLGLITHPYTLAFADIDQWNDYSKNVFLKTERFMDPYSFHTGSGRGAILGAGQYKGIGRTNGANRLDWLHSWGGLKIEEAISEIILERLLNLKYPEFSVPLLGGFLYQDRNQCFLIRSSDYIRCEQIYPQLLAADKSKIIVDLSLKFKSDSSLWHENLCLRFIELCQNGFIHLSPTKENISLDGRFLDHHSLDYITGNIPQGPLIYEVVFDSPLVNDLKGKDLINSVKASTIKRTDHHFFVLVKKCLAIKESFDILGIKTLSHEEITILIKKHFPVWQEMISSEKDFFIHRLETQDYSRAFISYNGTLMMEVGDRQRLKMIQIIMRVLKFHQKSGTPLSPEILKEIVHKTSEHLLGKDICYS